MANNIEQQDGGNDDSNKVHSDAFDEAAAKLAGEDTDSDESTSPNDGDGDGDGNGEAAETEDGTRNAADNAEDGNGDDGQDDGGEGEQDYKALLDKERQRTRSWEGRISKAERLAKELAEENQRLKAGMESDDNAAGGEADAGDHADDTLSAEDQAALDELANDYPVIYRALNAATKKVANDSGKKVVERISKVENTIRTQEESSRIAHFQALDGAHPNWREDYIHSGELDEWIESLPYRDANRYLAIKKNGGTESVLTMFDEFAKATGRQVAVSRETNRQPTTKNKRLESMTAVPRHSGKPAARGGTPSRDDFEGGFERGAAEHTR